MATSNTSERVAAASSASPPSRLDRGLHSVAWFSQATGLFCLLLLAATWRLWMPGGAFPRVPLWSPGMLGGVEPWGSRLAFGLMVLGAGTLLRGPTRVRRVQPNRFGVFRWALPVGWVIAVSLDQHRLQPWAYQFVLITVVLQLAPRKQSGKLLRCLAGGVYFWSALSKFDYQFAYSVGSQFVGELWRQVGGNENSLSVSLAARLALLLPLGELLLVPLLAWSRTRPWAAGLAVVMHLTLLLILGPLGLGHAPGVLLWNCFFTVQALLLFGLADTRDSSPEPASRELPPNLWGGHLNWASGLILVVLLAPLGERSGWWDHWPAWALYAPHSSRVRMEVPAARVSDLPDSLRRLVEEDSGDAVADREPWEWVELPLDRWSLETQRVPIYPQARFQLGVALAAADWAGLDRDVRITLRGPAGRLRGQREEQRLVGLDAARQVARQFWLNALPASGR